MFILISVHLLALYYVTSTYRLCVKILEIKHDVYRVTGGIND